MQCEILAGSTVRCKWFGWWSTGCVSEILMRCVGTVSPAMGLQQESTQGVGFMPKHVKEPNHVAHMLLNLYLLDVYCRTYLRVCRKVSACLVLQCYTVGFVRQCKSRHLVSLLRGPTRYIIIFHVQTSICIGEALMSPHPGLTTPYVNGNGLVSVIADVHFALGLSPAGMHQSISRPDPEVDRSALTVLGNV